MTDNDRSHRAFEGTSDSISLYLRTFYSLLRSSGGVRVRAFEEAHAFSDSTLHAGARGVVPDVAAFAYAGARLPSCMPYVRQIVLGQSHEQFEAAGFNVRTWSELRTRGRRRPLRYDGDETLAVFVTSTSDIDDLIPIITAYQIEWNKLHARLAGSALGRAIARTPAEDPIDIDDAEFSALLDLDAAGVSTLRAAFGESIDHGLRQIVARDADLMIRSLSASYSGYQRAAHRWWSGLEPVYIQKSPPKRPPVYFVSSNTHSLLNLLGGYARDHRNEIIDYLRRKNPERLGEVLDQATERNDDTTLSNLSYYLLRAWLHDSESDTRERLEAVQRYDAESGVHTINSPGHIDVGAQLIELKSLQKSRVDPRVCVPGFERLAQSDAVIVNIDYPLGMAAYHLFSRLAQGSGDILGAYVMGKAATLNGRVGDVMVSDTVYDEHSGNTYLFRNAFTAADVQAHLRRGTVLDGQKALTVRSAFLQNRAYMERYYHEGYTVLEMEAGPYLSAVFELTFAERHPRREVINLCNVAPFDVGILHYASDTPYSRRQELLSKSLSYFGVESTYGCASAILQRILSREVQRLASL
ncbi:MAG: hypothetical protein Q8Q09_17665 [Deltaproteobacteria bacterium]|nr:hypothetical protein [Deltaproteobacteria bacterium]